MADQDVRTLSDLLRLIAPSQRLSVMTTFGEITGELVVTVENPKGGDPVLLGINDEEYGGQTTLVPWHAISRIRAA